MNNQTVKPELKSPEMKAKYFAQYWGQKIMFWTMNGHKDLHKISASSMSKQSITQKSILLTSLDHISDDDKKRVSEILELDNNESCSFEDGFDYRGWVRSESGHDSADVSYPMPLNVSDFLRSRGYALTWNGHSVQELIEAGYMKLREGGEDNG